MKPRRGPAFDWDVLDQRMIQPQLQQNRVETTGFLGSSGSSFGESSSLGDNYVPYLSNPEMAFAHLNDGSAELPAKAVEFSGSGDGGSLSKRWAQQTEESYQLQLALALRLSSEATCAEDTNSLDPLPDESASSYLPASAEAISHRFWEENETRIVWLPNSNLLTRDAALLFLTVLHYSVLWASSF